MKEPVWRQFASVAGLGVALSLLAAGRGRIYDVEPDPQSAVAAISAPPPFVEPSFAPRSSFLPPPTPAPSATITNLTDLGLVENATFTGVIRKDGQLRFTYNPARKRGKKACPT